MPVNPGTPGTGITGFLSALGGSNTAGAFVLIAATLAVILAVITVVLFARKRKLIHKYSRSRKAANRAPLITAPLAVLLFAAAIICIGTKTANADDPLSISTTTPNPTINVVIPAEASPTGTSAGDVSSQVTVTTAIEDGYILYASAEISSPDITLSLSGGTTSPVNLTTADQEVMVSDYATPATGDELDFTLTAEVLNTLPVGTYTAELIYTATAEEPVVQASYCTTTLGQNIQDTRFIVDMDENIVPVTYTGDTTTPEWQVADDTNWCDYNSSQWANAVSLKADKVAEYKAADPGTVVLDDDVLGYWVYVPRYAYQVQRFSPSDPAICGDGTTTADTITNPGGVCVNKGATAFNIAFETAIAPKSTPAATGDWATHPAFTFGTTELNGIWVGKFDTSYGTADYNTVNEVKTDSVYVKPDQFALTWQDIAYQFLTAQDVSTQHNLTASTDTRMMKNDDWGAVAYLATSGYGRGATEVWINNACYRGYPITGRTGSSVSAGNYCYPDIDSMIADTTGTHAYYSAIGPNASTTNNVYGVYDMSGGAWEQTLSNYNKATGSSGFVAGSTTAFSVSGTDVPDKYFNFYMNPPFSGYPDSNFGFCTWSICGGQATFETLAVSSVSSNNQSWFGDTSYFVYAGGGSGSWALRGDAFGYGATAGLFANNMGPGGSAVSYVGFRIVQSKF